MEWTVQDAYYWNQLQDGLLLLADGDPEGSARRLRRLRGEISGSSPLLPTVLYHLGEALLASGDRAGAKDALREGVRTGCARQRCLALLGRLDLEEAAIHEVPTRWTFEEGDHGFMHPWSLVERGSIHVEREGDQAALAWTTLVEVRKSDQLVVGFDNPEPMPRGIRFEASSRAMDAYIRPQLVDSTGKVYTLPDQLVVLAQGDVVKVQLPLDDFLSVEGQGPLDASDITLLVLEDVTAFHGTQTGENVVWLDDFEVF